MSLLQEAKNRIMDPFKARREKESLKESDRKTLSENVFSNGNGIGEVFHTYVEILTDGGYPSIPRVEIAARAMQLLILQKGSDSIYQDGGMSKLRDSFDGPQNTAATLLIDQLEEDLSRRRVDPFKLLNEYTYPTLVGSHSNLGRRLASAGY